MNKKYIDAREAKLKIATEVAEEQAKYEKYESYIAFLNGFNRLFDEKIDEMPAAKVINAEELIKCLSNEMALCNRRQMKAIIEGNEKEGLEEHTVYKTLCAVKTLVEKMIEEQKDNDI